MDVSMPTQDKTNRLFIYEKMFKLHMYVTLDIWNEFAPSIFIYRQETAIGSKQNYS